MPNRWLAISISVFWLAMMSWLIRRDVLPRWMVSQRRDPRAMVKAVENTGPVRWAVLQDDQRVGWAETAWHRRPGGWTEFSSRAELKQLPWLAAIDPAADSGPLRWHSSFHITPDGDLEHFDVEVQSKWSLSVHGRVEKDLMRVSFRSGAIFHEEQFYFDQRSLMSLMTSSLAPMDRLPNLKVGQTWQDRVMNPILSTTEIVRSEVVSEQVITWRGDPVPTYLVEQGYGPLQARCWVTHDGLILRQEVPFGKNLIGLERE